MDTVVANHRYMCDVKSQSLYCVSFRVRSELFRTRSAMHERSWAEVMRPKSTIHGDQDHRSRWLMADSSKLFFIHTCSPLAPTTFQLSLCLFFDVFVLFQAIRAFPALPVCGFDGRAPRRPFPGARVLLAGSGRFPRPCEKDGRGENEARMLMLALCLFSDGRSARRR